MDLATLSVGSLRDGILKVAALRNNTYRKAAKKQSILLRDLPIGPRELATWWVEHVARHGEANHLKSTTRHMGVIRYYSLDVGAFYIVIIMVLIYGLKRLCWRQIRKQGTFKKKID